MSKILLGVRYNHQKIVRYWVYRFMLFNKKSKNLEDKFKARNHQISRKGKKYKNASPGKTKTPDKKYKKDENRIYHHNQTQPIEMHKYKDNWKNSNRNIQKDQRSKLLTTSPVLFDRSASISQQISKQKSKERSASRARTHRSNYGDREKDLIKNVTRKLYTNSSQVPKQKSYEKSKSKSKSRKRMNTGRDISPIRQVRRGKKFNVADREVKLKKGDLLEHKKSSKKKSKNKNKVEQTYSIMPTQRTYIELEEPKIKLRKQVPQIKTEFSQRRGSYFDQNLLKKLQFRQPQQKCPFIHAKSHFEYKESNPNVELYSRSEMKTFQEMSHGSFKQRQLQVFKKDQQMKWGKMLDELHNLKREKQVPQKIDDLIRQLNENYSSLQEKAFSLQKSKSEKEEEKQWGLSEYVPPKFAVLQTAEGQAQSKGLLQNKGVDLIDILWIDEGSNGKGDQDNVTLGLSALGDRRQQSPKDKPQSSISIKLQSSIQIPFPEEEAVPQALEKQQKYLQEQSLVEQVTVNLENKRHNSINLSSDFFHFHQTPTNTLKLQLLQCCPEPQPHQVSNQAIQQVSEHKQSDKDLLQSLNILEQPSDFLDVISFSKEHRFQFEAELQSIRMVQSQQFHQSMHPTPFSKELKICEQLSSQSILLPQESNPKLQRLINQIQHVLILQFSTAILRSKDMLHHFLTTYSQLVDTNLVNTHYIQDQPRTTMPCDNYHVLALFTRLLNHIEVNYQAYFLQQVKIPFQCQPIEILRFIRCADDEPNSLMVSERDCHEPPLAMPFFGMDKIQQFQRDVLMNEYYIPNYFSFNHCLYDLFNDSVDELRPHGSKGKSIFSLQLSHPVCDFVGAKEKIVRGVSECLQMNYYQQGPAQQRYPSEEGIFELTYFTCLDVMEQVFDIQTLILYQIMQK